MISLKKVMVSIHLMAVVVLCTMLSAEAATIPVVTQLEWDGTIAVWNSVEDAYQYEVTIYKNGVKQSNTVSTSETKIELKNMMTKKGNYTYQIRVKDRISDQFGKMSRESSVYIKEKDDSTSNNSSSKSKSNSTSTKVKQPGEKLDGDLGPGASSLNWVKDSYGWWYQNEDGSYPKNMWYFIDYKWYYFDGNGYMKTGWIVIENNRYYCDSNGARVTGWVNLSDGIYYFDVNGIQTSGR